jgi:RNA polymerase sigma-54 factor
MAKLSLQLKLGQQLTMTPQLQQAIRLLQMPVLELNDQLVEALETNVMLEQEEPAELAQTKPEDKVVDGGESEQAADWENLYSGGGNAGPNNWTGEDQAFDPPDTSDQTLHEHLIWQLEIDDYSPRETTIGNAIIDYIDDDGYLTEPLETIQSALPESGQFTVAETEAMLERIQTLDPLGIGARSPNECIAIQLRALRADEPGRDLAIDITLNNLDMVAQQDYANLRRQLGVSDADIDTALALIRACHPRPGSAIQPSTAQYVVPDVFVRKEDGKWIVEVNRSITPRIFVNQAYADMLRGNGANSVLRTQLQEAKWLVRSLEIRNDTLTRVAMSIVARQIEFLEHGEVAMRPMVLRDIAEELEMHESTISRVTTNKFMHTPRGVFEFRYFFSSQLSTSDGGEESSTAIRARIKRLIGEENPAKPLSDNKIAQLLAADGIKVARRTVAKYREGMKILPSSERRERTSAR